jgi:hypothetical protein
MGTVRGQYWAGEVRRWPVAAVLAAAAFAYGAYVAGNAWLGLVHGVVLLDGRPATEMVPPKWKVHTPLLLPIFLVSAIIGAISALALAIHWHGPPAGE